MEDQDPTGLGAFKRKILEDLELSARAVLKRAEELDARLGEGEGPPLEPFVRQLQMLAAQIALEKERWVRVLKMDASSALALAEERVRLAEAALRRMESYAASLDSELGRARSEAASKEQAARDAQRETLRLKLEADRLSKLFTAALNEKNERFEAESKALDERRQSGLDLRADDLKRELQRAAAREAALLKKLGSEEEQWRGRLEQAEAAAARREQALLEATRESGQAAAASLRQSLEEERARREAAEAAVSAREREASARQAESAEALSALEARAAEAEAARQALEARIAEGGAGTESALSQARSAQAELEAARAQAAEREARQAEELAALRETLGVLRKDKDELAAKLAERGADPEPPQEAKAEKTLIMPPPAPPAPLDPSLPPDLSSLVHTYQPPWSSEKAKLEQALAEARSQLAGAIAEAGRLSTLLEAAKAESATLKDRAFAVRAEAAAAAQLAHSSERLTEELALHRQNAEELRAQLKAARAEGLRVHGEQILKEEKLEAVLDLQQTQLDAQEKELEQLRTLGKWTEGVPGRDPALLRMEQELSGKAAELEGLKGELERCRQAWQASRRLLDRMEPDLERLRFENQALKDALKSRPPLKTFEEDKTVQLPPPPPPPGEPPTPPQA